MKKMIFFLTLLLFCLHPVSTWAQSEDPEPTIEIDSLIDVSWKDFVDSLYVDFDTSLVTTGILMERSPAYINWLHYNGFDTVRMNQDSIMQLYSEWFLALYDNSSYLDVFELDSISKAFAEEEDLVPFLLMAYEFNTLGVEALDSGWFDYNGSKIINLTPLGKESLDQYVLYAGSPMQNKIKRGTISFVISEDYFVSHNMGQPDEIRFHFGDAYGYRIMEWDVPVEINTLYMDTLFVDVELIYDTDTFRLFSYTPTETSTSMMRIIDNNHSMVEHFYVNGIQHSYGIWYGCESDNNVVMPSTSYLIRKPAIIIEGYDPDNSRNLISSQFLDCSKPSIEWEDGNLYQLVNEQDMASSIRRGGYDVVILSYGDGNASLNDKAEAVKELLRILRAKQIAAGFNFEFIIVAPSEAGLVVREALAEMEYNNEDHNTRLFVSLDAPHQGANVPMCMQMLVNFGYFHLPPMWVLQQMFKSVRLPLDIIRGMPSKQMLSYHEMNHQNNQASSIILQDHVNYFNYIRTLTTNYGYPVKCRNVGIAEGAGNGNGQGYSAHDKLFDFDIYLGLINLITDGWALPDGGSDQLIFRGQAIYLLPFQNSIIPFYSQKRARVSDTKPYDNTQGGFTSFTYDLIEGSLPKFATSISYRNYYHRRSSSFISTISALDILSAGNDLSYDVFANITGQDGIAFRGIDYTNSVSRLDAIMAQPQNEFHVICGINSDIADFINDEVMYNDYYLQNIQIATPRDYEAKQKLRIGENVSNRMTQGDVSIYNPGLVRIRAGNEIQVSQGVRIHPSNSGEVRLYINPFHNDCASSIRQQSGGGHPIVAESMVDKDVLKMPLDHNIMQADTIVLYPNPAQHQVVIQAYSSVTGNYHLLFFDLFGKQLREIKGIIDSGNRQEIGVDISDLPNGTYIIRSTLPSGYHHIIKFIKTS